MADQRSKDLQLHLTAAIIPPPEYVAEGLKEERLTRYCMLSTLGADMGYLLAKIEELGIFAQGGSVVLMIQPTRKVAPNG